MGVSNRRLTRFGADPLAAAGRRRRSRGQGGARRRRDRPAVFLSRSPGREGRQTIAAAGRVRTAAATRQPRLSRRRPAAAESPRLPGFCRATAEGKVGAGFGLTRAPDAAQRVALAKRCAAEPGPYQPPALGTVPVLRSSASQELRAASRPGHETSLLPLLLALAVLLFLLVLVLFLVLV